jgi:alpha-ribazole phosphatase
MAAHVELWLARHARALVEPGTCYGRSDVPADPAHTAEAARALATALAEMPVPRLLVFASPLQRTQALAQALVQQWPAALHIHTDPRLAEMDFGAWEGQPWSALTAEAFAPWDQNFAHHRVGGGESVAQFMGRVATAWDDCRRTCQEHALTRVVWITHAGVARAMSLLHSGVTCPTQGSDWPREAPAPGRWVVQHWPAPG